MPEDDPDFERFWTRLRGPRPPPKEEPAPKESPLVELLRNKVPLDFHGATHAWLSPITNSSGVPLHSLGRVRTPLVMEAGEITLTWEQEILQELTITGLALWADETSTEPLAVTYFPAPARGFAGDHFNGTFTISFNT